MAYRMFNISGSGIGESELMSMLSRSVGNQLSMTQLQTVRSQQCARATHETALSWCCQIQTVTR